VKNFDLEVIYPFKIAGEPEWCEHIVARLQADNYFTGSPLDKEWSSFTTFKVNQNLVDPEDEPERAAFFGLVEKIFKLDGVRSVYVKDENMLIIFFSGAQVPRDELKNMFYDFYGISCS